MSLHLLPTRDFPAIAAAAGIHQTPRTLALTGALPPVTVGRRTYYRLQDVLALVPGERRTDLTGRTVTVERATPLTAAMAGVRRGAPVVVERADGQVEAADASESVYPSPATIARRHAREIGARYVPAGGAR
ncbi:MAG: hypothetical protein ACRDQ0_03205 [Pseudonocardia sp.]